MISLSPRGGNYNHRTRGLAHLRKDVIREDEFDKIIAKVGKGAAYETPTPERIRRDLALFSTAYVFGQRPSEILRLKREDCMIVGDKLRIRFTIQKHELIKKMQDEEGKKRLLLNPIQLKATKSKNINHKYVRYIVDQIKTLKFKEAPLFPAINPISNVEMKALNVKSFYWLCNKYGVYPYLFRESLATKMSENGVPIPTMMRHFNWSRAERAEHYSRKGGGVEEEWLSDQEF